MAVGEAHCRNEMILFLLHPSFQDVQATEGFLADQKINMVKLSAHSALDVQGLIRLVTPARHTPHKSKANQI